MPRPPRHLSRAERRRFALEAALFAAIPVLGAILPPHRPLPFDLCVWHRLTGLSCLGCGLTRSVCALMHGDIAGSLALHPAGLVVAALCAAIVLRRGAAAALGRTP